jgi:hypothetical protein
MITNIKDSEISLLRTESLQNAIFESFIQTFNISAQRMLGYSPVNVINEISPMIQLDAQQLIVSIKSHNIEHQTTITNCFETLVFRVKFAIEDINELTFIDKNGDLFPSKMLISALSDQLNGIIGYLLTDTDNKAMKVILRFSLSTSILFHTRPNIIITDNNVTIINVNTIFIGITGFSQEETIGQNPRHLKSGKQRPNFMAECVTRG